ncbi:MAG TPA: DMT family transporter [Chloroflexaceae bacterium]|nr:DMT family transporter [Chloroflexaceae bacterium]
MGATTEAAGAGAPALPLPAYAGLALTFSFLWSTGFIAAEFGLERSPPLFMMGFRFVLAGGLLLLIVALLRRPLPRSRRDLGRLVVLGILSFAMFFGMTGYALQGIAAGTGAVLASTNPLMLALVAPFALGERLGPRKATGMAVAFASVAVMMSSRMGVGDSPAHMGLVLLANGSMVAGTILFKRWALPYDLAGMTAIQLLVGGVVLLGLSLPFEPVASVRWDAGFLLTLLYMCVVLSWATMLLYLFLVRSGDASRANAFLFLNPVFGLFLGALILGEPLSGVDLVGTAGVALGIWLVLQSR